MIYWEKHDHDNNRHSWYHVSLCRDLFGDLILSKKWGIIGRQGYQEKKLPLQTLEELPRHLLSLGKQRAAHGYMVTKVGGGPA